MSFRGPIFFLSLFLTTANASQGKLCYAPDGTTTPGNSSVYLPCIGIQGVDSMCCALNRTASLQDQCAPNGLCFANGNYFRDYCTDPTWKSPNCLPKTVCDAAAGGSSNGTPALTHCADGSWCCNFNNYTGCCDKNLGFRLPDILVSIVPGTANTTNSTSPSTSPTESTPASTSSTRQTSNDDSKATKIGVGVGVSLGVIAIVGTIAGFWFGQKRGESIASKRLSGASNGGGFSSPPQKGEYQPVIAEVAGTSGVHEVPATPIALGRYGEH